MRIAVAFDTPYADWTPEQHAAQMAIDLANQRKVEPDMEYQVAQALQKNGHDVLLTRRPRRSARHEHAPRRLEARPRVQRDRGVPRRLEARLPRPRIARVRGLPVHRRSPAGAARHAQQGDEQEDPRLPWREGPRVRVLSGRRETRWRDRAALPVDRQAAAVRRLGGHRPGVDRSRRRGARRSGSRSSTSGSRSPRSPRSTSRAASSTRR